MANSEIQVKSPRKQVPVEAVKLGMYIEEAYTATGPFTLTNHIAVRAVTQLEGLRKRGIVTVTINTERGRDIDGTAATAGNADTLNTAAREAAYYLELDKAREIHREAVALVGKLLRAIKAGAEFHTRDIHKIAEDMAASLSRNPDALVSLTQIKGIEEYTTVHSVNVGILTASLAKEKGVAGEPLVETAYGGLLHDIGKMKVPDAILNKPGKLTDLEFATIKRHPEYGLELLAGKNVSDIAKKVIGQHHERFNGKGYPLGLEGPRIHEAAFMGAVSDVFDALTSDRVYKEAFTPQKALAMIFQGCDVDYSRKTVELFTRHLGIFPVGSFIKLIGGEIGLVMRIERGHLLAPRMLVLYDAAGIKLPKPVEYDLFDKQKGPSGDQFKIEVSLNPKSYGVTVSDYL